MCDNCGGKNGPAKKVKVVEGTEYFLCEDCFDAWEDE